MQKSHESRVSVSVSHPRESRNARVTQKWGHATSSSRTFGSDPVDQQRTSPTACTCSECRACFASPPIARQSRRLAANIQRGDRRNDRRSTLHTWHGAACDTASEPCESAAQVASGAASLGRKGACVPPWMRVAHALHTRAATQEDAELNTEWRASVVQGHRLCAHGSGARLPNSGAAPVCTSTSRSASITVTLS